MSRPKTILVDFASFAKRYNVTERTVRSWHAAGVDLNDLEAVADHLLRQRSPSPTAMAATLESLTTSSYESNPIS